MTEEQAREFLSALLMDVPLARRSGDSDLYFEKLYVAALFFPVFHDWPSPVLDWLDEAERLSASRGESDEAALLDIRRSAVLMRMNELEAAAKHLALVEERGGLASSRVRCYAAATRSRLHTRNHAFDEARKAWEEAAAASVNSDDWIAALPEIARAEWLLETNDVKAAHSALLGVLHHLPEEMVEERVQALQSLGFVFITLTNIKKAIDYLDEARQILIGAGIWPEVIQMSLVVANFYVSLGKIGKAERLFNEALDLSRQHELPAWEALLQLGLARTKVTRGAYESAIKPSLNAAHLFARQGNVVAYTSIISYVARIYMTDNNYKEAYRTLAVGVSIAKHLQLPVAENVFRSQIDDLRVNHLGPSKFDAMVQEMVDEEKQSRRDNGIE